MPVADTWEITRRPPGARPSWAGVDLFGQLRRRDGRLIATRFFHLLRLPLVPLGSVVLLGDDDPARQRDVSLAAASVAAGYARAWGVPAAGLLTALAFVGIARGGLTAALVLPMLALLATAGVIAGWTVWGVSRRPFPGARGLLIFGLPLMVLCSAFVALLGHRLARTHRGVTEPSWAGVIAAEALIEPPAPRPPTAKPIAPPLSGMQAALVAPEDEDESCGELGARASLLALDLGQLSVALGSEAEVRDWLSSPQLRGVAERAELAEAIGATETLALLRITRERRRRRRTELAGWLELRRVADGAAVCAVRLSVVARGSSDKARARLIQEAQGTARRLTGAGLDLPPPPRG